MNKIKQILFEDNTNTNLMTAIGIILGINALLWIVLGVAFNLYKE